VFEGRNKMLPVVCLKETGDDVDNHRISTLTIVLIGLMCLFAAIIVIAMICFCAFYASL